MINNLFNPTYIIKFISKTSLLFFMIMVFLFTYGIFYGLFNSPPDYQQGEMVRLMYVHVPASWMSLMIYSFIAINSAIFLILLSPMANVIAKSSSYIGLTFTFISLITGSLWGKPIWGTWWVWDARLTSMLILFFFYLGYILLSKANEENINSKAPAVLAVVGFINVPIVKFSVDLWHSLHQPASILKISGPSIHISMLKPLIAMILGSFFYFVWILMISIKIKILENKIDKIISKKISFHHNHG